MWFSKSISLFFLASFISFSLLAQQPQGEFSGRGGRPQRSEMEGGMRMPPHMMENLTDEQRARIMERFSNVDTPTATASTSESTTPAPPARNIFAQIKAAEKRISIEFPTEYQALLKLRLKNMPAARDEFTRLYRLLPALEKRGERPERGEPPHHEDSSKEVVIEPITPPAEVE